MEIVIRLCRKKIRRITADLNYCRCLEIGKVAVQFYPPQSRVPCNILGVLLIVMDGDREVLAPQSLRITTYTGERPRGNVDITVTGRPREIYSKHEGKDLDMI